MLIIRKRNVEAKVDSKVSEKVEAKHEETAEEKADTHSRLVALFLVLQWSSSFGWLSTRMIDVNILCS